MTFRGVRVHRSNDFGEFPRADAMSRGSKTGTRSVFATRKVRKRDGGASDDESDGDGDGDAAARVDVDARHR
jgi:hypothetical protein